MTMPNIAKVMIVGIHCMIVLDVSVLVLVAAKTGEATAALPIPAKVNSVRKMVKILFLFIFHSPFWTKVNRTLDI
jgi:hypothetical protein